MNQDTSTNTSNNSYKKTIDISKKLDVYKSVFEGYNSRLNQISKDIKVIEDFLKNHGICHVINGDIDHGILHLQSGIKKKQVIASYFDDYTDDGESLSKYRNAPKTSDMLTRTRLTWRKHSESGKFRLFLLLEEYTMIYKILEDDALSFNPYSEKTFLHADAEEPTVIYDKPLLECPVDARLRMYPHLEDFISKAAQSCSIGTNAAKEAEDDELIDAFTDGVKEREEEREAALQETVEQINTHTEDKSTEETKIKFFDDLLKSLDEEGDQNENQ